MAAAFKKTSAALGGEARREESAFLAAAIADPKILRKRLVLAIAIAPPKARRRGGRWPQRVNATGRG